MSKSKRNPFCPQRYQGRLFVLSAPSGSGKTTLLKQLQKFGRNVFLSVSVTTRHPRAGEKSGKDYFFVTSHQFQKMRRNGQFLEEARILGHCYGTPRGPILRALTRGQDVLLGVDIKGARQIRRSHFPSTTVFLLPPSLTVLRERLKRRGTETPAQIRERLLLARQELEEVEKYDYAVVNDRLSEAMESLKAILEAERCRIRR